MMTLNELFQHGKEFAAVAFNGQGELTPMWICVTEDEEVLPIVVPMIGDKDEIITALRQFLKQKGVIRYVSMIEAWMLEAKNKNQNYQDLIKDGPIRANPDRVEIVNIEAADHYGNSKMGFYRIVRPADGPPYLARFEEMDGDSSGRFSNLLMEMQ